MLDFINCKMTLEFQIADWLSATLSDLFLFLSRTTINTTDHSIILYLLSDFPLTVSCFSKIQIGALAHSDSPRQRSIKRVCVCTCMCVYLTSMTVVMYHATCWQPKYECSRSPSTSVQLTKVVSSETFGDFRGKIPEIYK